MDMENNGFNEVHIKKEPGDTPENCAAQEQETGDGTQVWIKVEPIEPEDIEVKCDPFECEDDADKNSEVDVCPEIDICPEINVHQTTVEKNTRPKRKTKKRINLDNDDEDTESSKKAPAKKKLRRHVTKYEDVYDFIDTIKLTEEDRVREHQNTLIFLTPLEYVCKDCAMGYNTKESYEEHMKEHSVHLGNYLCELCNTHYQTSRALEDHKQSHFTRYSCSFCQTQFKQRETAGCHIIQLHKHDAMFGCSYCPKGFRRVSFLKAHEEICPNSKKFACYRCHKEFKNKIELNLHNRVHKSEKKKKKKEPLVCKFCSRVYQCRASLTRHLLSHDLNVTCEECNIVFPNRLVLRHHSYEAHNPQNAHKYGQKACPHCPRVCVSSAMLKRHVDRMHKDRSRKFECDYCNRMYYTKGDVRSHIAWSHCGGQGRREHVCHCGHVTRSVMLLNRHQRAHHGPFRKDFVCSFCGEAFQFKKFLKRHMMIHPEKSLACEKCGLMFGSRAEVRAHRTIHSDEPKKSRGKKKQEEVAEPVIGEDRPAQGENVEESSLPTKFEVEVQVESQDQMYFSDSNVKCEMLEVNVSPSMTFGRGHKAQRGRPPRVDYL